MKNISSVEITFNSPVTLSQEFKQKLDEILTKVCKEWEAENPGQIMWPFGSGFKMLCHPMMIEDDKPIPFDESCYHIEVTNRKAYEGERNFKND